jgi:flagellar basal body-associated protein FliL
MTDQDDNGKNVKIGIVSILTLAAVILGFFFVAVLNHEARISKTEANQEYVVKSVDEIKCSLKDLNNKLDGIKK